MLWIQEIIDLLDRSGGAHHSGLQLLRAKLDSIKHLESYRDLMRFPLLSLSWEEIQNIMSLFSDISLWTAEDDSKAQDRREAQPRPTTGSETTLFTDTD
jgi:hypothetical protein